MGPAWSVTPVDGDLPNTEGTFIRYRGHHAGHAPAPAFWFGHRLGYSTWDYSAPELIITVDGFTVAVTVTNTGTRTSREVVQVYLQPADPSQPIQLVGWTTANATAGASADVTVDRDCRLWRRWDISADD